jgi:hypothetical protein
MVYWEKRGCFTFWEFNLQPSKSNVNWIIWIIMMVFYVINREGFNNSTISKNLFNQVIIDFNLFKLSKII